MIDLKRLTSNQVEIIELTAIIDTALCVGAGGSSGSLADKPIVRNAEGKLLIPASQLKGRLRHECEKLARGLGWQIFSSPNAETLCPIEEQVDEQFKEIYKVAGYRGYHCFVSKIFGNPILPSRIIVDDLICIKAADDLPSEILRPGVTINRSRRTAEEKKLYFLETSPANAQLEFKGAIHLLQPDCPAYAKTLIIAALHHIHALGGSKSAGLGWLHWQGLPQIEQNDAIWSGLLPNKMP
ncbi:MAG: RAMP superfamily CRISPR-associated protein [Coleofasciculaceae cyanobacterium]